MAIDKKINYEMQGGVKNYRPSEMVTAPKIAKSSPDTPTAKLAYITPEEQKILIDLNLYGSLKGKPNRGPSGLPSLEGDFGPGGNNPGGFRGGGDYSSAETGNFSGFDGTGVPGTNPELPPGVNPTPSKEAQDIRNAFINAGGGQRVNPGFFDSRTFLSPTEIASAKNYRNQRNPDGQLTNRFAKKSYRNTGQSGIMNFLTGGGLWGNLIRGVGQKFGLGKRYDDTSTSISGKFNNNLSLYDDSQKQKAFYDNALYSDNYSDMKINQKPDLNNLESILAATAPQGIDNSMYGADQDKYRAATSPNIATLRDTYVNMDEFNPNVGLNTNFNIQAGPDGITYYDDDTQSQGIRSLDVGYDNPAFENDLMAKLSTKGTIEYNKLNNKKLQNEATDGITPALTPKEAEKLKQLEIQKNEATLNTTAIV